MVDATVMFEDPTAVTATRSHPNAIHREYCDRVENLITAKGSAERLCLLTEDHLSLGRSGVIAVMKLEKLVVFLTVQGSECRFKMSQVELVFRSGLYSEERCFDDDASSASNTSRGE